MTLLHGKDKASAARAAPVLANAYQDSFTVADYWQACGQSDKPERLRVPHRAQKRHEKNADYWQRATEEITAYRRRREKDALLPEDFAPDLRYMAAQAPHCTGHEPQAWILYGETLRRCHRSAEARRFDFLSDAHARLTQAFRDGDAEMARAMLEQGVPPPRQANISETLNAHPELVEPLLFAVSPSGFQSQCLTPPPFTLPFGPSPWPLACLWAFAKGTERVRQAFLEHPCLQRNPHVSRALLSGVLQSDFLTGAKACALAKEVWGHFTPSQREALLQRTGHANPRISRFSANILGAALWRLASFSRCCDANERVEFLLSLLQPSRQEIQSLLEGTAEGISQECLRLLVDHGANATQALWSFIRAPQCGGPYQEANTLARFGARVSHAELEAFFKSPAGAVQSQWSRARLCKKLQSYGALIPDLPPAPAPRRRRFWELPKPRGH